MQIRPVGATLLHAGGRAGGHDDANSRYSQFRERAEMTRYLSWVGILFAARVCECVYIYALAVL